MSKPRSSKQSSESVVTPSKSLSFKVIIEKDRCKGCQLCIFYCPVKHLEYSPQLNKRGVRFIKVKAKNECIGCGFCFLICPESCIEIYESKSRSNKK